MLFPATTSANTAARRLAGACAGGAPPVEQDEFLAAAPLFRYGPWALMLVSAVLAVVVLVASLWRMEVSREGEYAKAFRFAAAAAKAVDANAAQVLALLRQATHAVEADQQRGGGVAALRAQFNAGLGLGDGIRVAATDAEGLIVAHTAGLEGLRRAQLQPLLAAAPGVPGPLVLPAMRLAGAEGPVVPVLHRLAPGGPAAAVVHLVDAGVLTGGFGAALDGQAGWLRLGDAEGRTVIDVAHGLAAAEFGDAALARVYHRAPRAARRSACSRPRWRRLAYR